MALILIGSLRLNADVIATSTTEFSGVQGQNDWICGYRNIPAAGAAENYDPERAFISFAGGECKGDAKAKEAGGCKEKKDGACAEGAKKDGCDPAGCASCVEGAKEGKECCQEKVARTDLEIVTLAAVEGTSEAAKKESCWTEFKK
jgi:hypothetical protein